MKESPASTKTKETVKLSAFRSPLCPLHLAKLAGANGASACGQYACMCLLTDPTAWTPGEKRDTPYKGHKRRQ